MGLLMSQILHLKNLGSLGSIESKSICEDEVSKVQWTSTALNSHGLIAAHRANPLHFYSWKDKMQFFDLT